MITAIAIALSATTTAQIQNPVKWMSGVKRIEKNIYELHIRATIDDGWHIYAQNQSPDAIAVPTKISITKSPGLTLIGKPLEIGKKEKYEIKAAGITNMEYAGKVDFVQQVRIEPGIKEIKGTVTYQSCTHERCLAAETINFTVPIP